MKNLNNIFLLIGRLLIGGVFLSGGIGFLLNFEPTVGYVATVFPIPVLFTIGAIVFKILGGLSLILGYKMRIGVILLIIFTLMATFGYHNMFIDETQKIAFYKNLMVIGGLLAFYVAGVGKYSIGKK